MNDMASTTLGQALDQIHRLEDDDVVFARKPWTLESDAVISKLDRDLSVPKALLDKGLQYFLEVPLAKEVLSVFGAQQPTDAERRLLLLYYATHDAYPEWVYAEKKESKDA